MAHSLEVNCLDLNTGEVKYGRQQGVAVRVAGIKSVSEVK
jgi:hypothetical protein